MADATVLTLGGGGGGAGEVVSGVFNDAGADQDFRVEGDTEPNLLVTDAGNERVGVATVPDSTLHADVTGDKARFTTVSGTNLDILRGDNDAQAKIETTNHLVLNAAGSTSNLQFELEGAERMRLTRQGAGTQAALLIGDVYDGTFTADAKLVLRTSGDCGLHIVADTDNSGENDNPLIKMTQDGGDNATIGICGEAGQIYTGSISNTLYIRSDYQGTVQIVTGSTVAMTIDDDDVTIVGDLSCVALTETSDARLKEEVADLDIGVDYINSLRPVSYKRKGDDSDKRHFGLIAQEVGPVTPDAALVHYNENTDEYSLAYTQLIAPLIKSVQELSARVKELEGDTGETFIEEE